MKIIKKHLLILAPRFLNTTSLVLKTRWLKGAGLIILFILFLAQFVLIQNINCAQADSLWQTVQEGGLEKIGTKAYESGSTPKDPRDIVIDVVKVFLTFLALIFVVLIILAGYKWMTSGGNEEKIKEAKAQITRGIIGLVIILAAYSIASFVSEDVRKAITDEVW